MFERSTSEQTLTEQRRIALYINECLVLYINECFPSFHYVIRIHYDYINLHSILFFAILQHQQEHVFLQIRRAKASDSDIFSFRSPHHITPISHISHLNSFIFNLIFNEVIIVKHPHYTDDSKAHTKIFTREIANCQFKT